eukprot:364187-Chlamydomonas_euryale.AAC.15
MVGSVCELELTRLNQSVKGGLAEAGWASHVALSRELAVGAPHVAALLAEARVLHVRNEADEACHLRDGATSRNASARVRWHSSSARLRRRGSSAHA